MEERDKSILAFIEDLLRKEGGGSLCGSEDQSENFIQAVDMISNSSIKIFMLFKAEAMLSILIDNEASLKFLNIYCFEILQKSLNFLRAFLNQKDRKLSKISRGVICDVLNLVFFFGSGYDKIKDFTLLPNSFSAMVEHNFVEITAMHHGSPWLLGSNFPRTGGPAFTNFLLRNMSDSLEYNASDSGSITLLKHQVQVLLKELNDLQPFVKDMMQNNISEERILRLIYEAEYILANLLQAGGVPVRYKQLVLFNAIAEAKALKAEIQEYHHHHEVRQHGTNISAVQATLKEPNNSRAQEIIVGFEDRAKNIENQLITGSQERKIISIVGMGGVGKTTLARKVYDSLSIQSHFWARAWCTVSQVYQKKELLFQILGCIVNNIEGIKGMDEDDLANSLRKSLKETRYLVVVDDMWSLEAWNVLQNSLPDDRMGSRILFTTRDSKVASKGNPYDLPLLTAQESWNLFQKKLFDGDICPKELLEIGRLIVEICKGLPLAIVVIACLLEKMEKMEHLKDQWEKIALQLMSRTAHEDDAEKQIIHILEFSYNHLPSHLKPCFLYFGMFSEDQQIPVQKLKLMWIAEGFVQKIDSNSKSSEDIAEEYLVELLSRNLVMKGQRRSRGGVKSCQMHDTVRYLCLEKVREENFMQLVTLTDARHSGKSSSALISSSYRICFQPNTEQDQIPKNIVDPNVHSLLVSPSNVNGKQGYYIGQNIPNCPEFLRVLDTTSILFNAYVFRPSEKMRCLTYLAVRGYFQSVPSSIVSLFNLETLIMDGSTVGIDVSTELWSMRKLRHVRINSIENSSLPDKEIASNENIVSLSMLTIVNPIPAETFLRRLNGIRNLKCRFERHGHIYRNYVFPTVDTLHLLESLHLCATSYTNHIPFPSNLGFPSNLKKLTLEGLHLAVQNLSTIGGKLGNLEVLKILNCHEVGSRSTWGVSEGMFPELKYLKIYDFGFGNWIATSDSFPSLERLVLQRCPELKEIPISFGEIYSFQMIDIKDCSESAYASVEKIYATQVESGNKEFKVSITRQMN